MITEIKQIDEKSLLAAKEIIRLGGVVAMPTETVYGLGGDACNDDAVKRIFEIKGRPSDNPLIAHVHTGYDLSRLIDYDPPMAAKLRAAFLPGPLTIVYPSTGKVSPYVSCGLNTLAVRVPSHTGAQAFLRAVDIPIVAPSANISKHVSPTSAQHVYDDFNGKIPLILDGGSCRGGIESTVVDVTGEYPVILRPGLITREMIASVCGECGVYAPDLKPGDKAKSPGMLYKHYSPRCKTQLFKDDGLQTALQAVLAALQSGERVGVLCENAVVNEVRKGAANCTVFDLGATPEQMAANLFSALRQAEERVDVLVAIEPREKGGVMVGVLNRLRKACLSTDVAH